MYHYLFSPKLTIIFRLIQWNAAFTIPAAFLLDPAEMQKEAAHESISARQKDNHHGLNVARIIFLFNMIVCSFFICVKSLVSLLRFVVNELNFGFVLCCCI